MCGFIFFFFFEMWRERERERDSHKPNKTRRIDNGYEYRQKLTP